MKKTALAILLGSALFAGSAVAHEAGSFIARLGGAYVQANSSSKTTTAVDVDLKVKNNAQVGLTLGYMLTDNIAIELLGATPFYHKIDAKVPALGLGLGNVVTVKHLPPSLYAQYYFGNAKSPVRPYVGAGINYTRFFDAESINPAVTDLKVKKHSVGPVANLGLDVKLTDNFYFNAAAYYTRIKTKANFKALGLDHEVKIKLDPVVYFSGFTFKF